MAKSKKQEAVQYKSAHNGILNVGGVEFACGESKELNEEILNIANVKHAIKIGLLVEA